MISFLDDLSNHRPPANSVLTIGNFDGVHRAHQALISEARRAARNESPVVVLTFDPHPLSIVAPRRVPPSLMPLAERRARLAEAGADHVAVARSDRELLSLSAEEFIRDVVCARFRPVCLVEGPTFGFGRGRRGNVDLLKTLGEVHRFTVYVVPALSVVLDGAPVTVSSSAIRNLLEAGQVESARTLLGRPYGLHGDVVHGEARGRTIGFPTVNLRTATQVIPGDGVYAGRTSVGDAQYPCAISIGHKATFGEGPRSIEAHLIGFSGELYGRTLRLDFHRRLRDQRRFESVEALVSQLRRDVEMARTCGDALEAGPMPVQTVPFRGNPEKPACEYASA
jgi:riboflavin kinase/FMN adenylyltransferase